jgi:hypothetical protein
MILISLCLKGLHSCPRSCVLIPVHFEKKNLVRISSVSHVVIELIWVCLCAPCDVWHDSECRDVSGTEKCHVPSTILCPQILLFFTELASRLFFVCLPSWKRETRCI